MLLCGSLLCCYMFLDNNGNSKAHMNKVHQALSDNTLVRSCMVLSFQEIWIKIGLLADKLSQTFEDFSLKHSKLKLLTDC